MQRWTRDLSFMFVYEIDKDEFYCSEKKKKQKAEAEGF